MKKTNKIKIFLEGLIVITVVLTLIMPTSAVITNSNEDSMASSLVKKADIKLQKASIAKRTLTIEGEDIPAAAEIGDEYTPAIVKDNDDNLWLFYVMKEGLNSDIYIRKSSDNGKTWLSEDVWYLNIEGFQIDPVATVDINGMLWTAFIDEEEDTIFFLEGQDPSQDPATWLWNVFTSDTATDHMHLGSIATYQTDRTIAAHCYIADIDFPPYGLFPDAATIEHNGGVGQWTYTWDGDFQDILSSYPSIGASNDLFFFAFQYTDNVSEKERINVRWGDAVTQTDMQEWKNEWGMFVTSDTFNAQKPSVAGSGTNVILVYQSDEAGNQDLICSYSGDDGETWNHDVVVVNDVADEENPRVFMSGKTAYCLYVKEGNLYLIISEDSGATWGESEQINDEVGSVENEWRTAEIDFPYLVWTDNRGDDLDIYFDLGGVAPPDLEINEVKGGSSIRAVVKNVGSTDATGVTYSINIEGGLIINPRTGTGPVGTGTLAPNQSEEVSLKPKGIGLGIITSLPQITITAECNEGISAEKTVDARIILFFVILQ